MTAPVASAALRTIPVAQSSMRLAVVTGGVPHYRWSFFTELADRGAAVHVVAAGRLPPGILATPSPDARVGITQLPAGRRRWRSDVLAALGRIDPDVVLLEHGASLDYSWTALLSRRITAPRVLWTHGIARQELYGGKKGLASWGRWTQLALSDGLACYDRQMAATMARHFPDKVVGVAPNSTDGSAIVAERLRCEREGRDEVRRGLGLSARFYLVGLGRLVGEKDFGRLIRIGANLRKEGMDVGIILIGAGPEEHALRREAEALGMRADRDVVFTGGVSDSATLTRWLHASDACVSPGFLGLSVVDCLFAGVPVISFEPSRAGPHHSPEWRYLVYGDTGFFAAEHTDESLTDVCRHYLEQPEAARERVRASCAEYAATTLGVARMADGMLDVIKTLRRPIRR